MQPQGSTEWSGHLSRLSVVAALALLLAACNVSQRVPASNQLALLPSQLTETSGLLCLDQDFISFNDSGGPSVLYRFDSSGRIHQQLQLSSENKDWEAITSDGQFLYLADSGNNSGARSDVIIYKVPLNWSGLTQPYSPERLDLIFSADKQRQPYQHDVDFEALVYKQNALWLISKSWSSQIPALYQVDPDVKRQKPAQAGHFAPPGFLVTDAVFDQRQQEWWLVGYPDPRKAIWAHLTHAGFQPQLARYDKNMQLLEIKALPTAGQVEGLCIDQDKQIWITEEGSPYSPARLIRVGTSSR